MPSRSWQIWNSSRSAALDEIRAAHTAIAGTAPGRRYATQQLNHAYAMLLSSQFQGFCRDLYSECVDCLMATGLPPPLSPIFRQNLLMHRKLDTGNPNPGNIGSDLNRLGIDFWATVLNGNPRARGWKTSLETLNTWRNAVAHQDFEDVGPNLHLAEVQRWRVACNGLARTFDNVMTAYLTHVVGAAPW